MRKTICEGYIGSWEESLYYRKHEELAQCYFEHVSHRYGEPKSISD